jgi:two-component system chemotaxis sensor kinase CheA
MKNFKNFDVDFLLGLYGDNVILSLTDTKGIIKYVSEAYVEISEYSKEELLGQPQNIVRHPDMPSSIFKELWETISSGKTWKGEIKNLKKNKQFYWVKATITPQIDEQGTIIGYASVRQDITDKKKAILLHNQIQNMIDNIEDGFLIFDKQFKVQESYSKNCLNILHQNNIYNKNISDILFDNDPEQKETFIFGCEQLFQTESSDTKEIYLSLLPKKHYNAENKFTIHYKILSDDTLLVLLRDITNQRELESKIKHEQKMQKMCITIATHKGESIELIQSFIGFLKKDFIEIDANKLKMDLHTFKGLFAQLEMIYTIESIHRLETLLKNEKFNNEHKKDLKNAFYKDIRMITDIFGHHFLSPITTVNVEVEQINKLVSDMQRIIDDKNESNNELCEILESLKHMKDQSFFNMLKVHQITVANVAKKIKKEIFPLEIIGSKEILVSEKFKNFTKSLVHIFTNSIVHGIEELYTREKYNKNSKGKIRCTFESIENNIILKISDDGQGVNALEVIEKAIELKLTTIEKAKSLSEQEILQFVFSNEFSTIDYVDELSGRGVGLASVKYELLRLNGTVHIENNRFKGLSFLFTIPYTDVINNDSTILANSIIETTQAFLKKDIHVESINISIIEKFTVTHYYSTIQLSGLTEVLLSISVDENLIDKILHFFIQDDDMKNQERVKINLTGEVLNIIAGLSIQNFPSDYNELTLGTPIVLDSTILETFIEHNQSTLMQIETKYGNFELAVVILNKTN